MYEPKLELSEGWEEGVQTKKPSMGGVWIFSGTTQYSMQSSQFVCYCYQGGKSYCFANLIII